MMHYSIISLFSLYGLLSTVSGAAISKAAVLPRSNSGQATYYGGNLQGGNCMFTTLASLPAGIYGTASANWDNSAHCGACVRVKGPNGASITAMIVDQCPGCGLNHLDLFPDAFAKLSNPSAGVIPVTWDYVPCPITAPLQLHNKSGASQYWFSMQVVGATKAVQSLEVSASGNGNWLPTQRQDYNFFQLSSGSVGTASASIRVTSVDGDVVVVNNVPLESDRSVTASNF